MAQLKTNICKSPDYYAPKVWLIDAGKAMNDPRRPSDPNADSTCWPFYLESYTAMSAIQAGSVDDGLEIMRHIQLLHLRNGWTWSQNLWRPGELTYVTAPVTWFITDVLAGSGLDVPNQTLHTETPGSTIFYTTDGRDPRLHGRPYNQPLMLTTDTTLRLAACAGKDWSPVRQQTYSREPYRTGDLPATSETGRWKWRYYEGPFERLPDFSKLTPLASGETDHLNLDMRRREDHFALVLEGVLEVRKRGLVTFHLASDDGSRLTIGGRDVLDHDGIHDMREKKTLAVPLEPGHYSLKLEYFQGDGGYALHLDWDAPDSISNSFSDPSSKLSP